jgi:hypothetical protein
MSFVLIIGYIHSAIVSQRPLICQYLTKDNKAQLMSANCRKPRKGFLFLQRLFCHQRRNRDLVNQALIGYFQSFMQLLATKIIIVRRKTTRF